MFSYILFWPVVYQLIHYMHILRDHIACPRICSLECINHSLYPPSRSPVFKSIRWWRAEKHVEEAPCPLSWHPVDIPWLLVPLYGDPKGFEYPPYPLPCSVFGGCGVQLSLCWVLSCHNSFPHRVSADIPKESWDWFLPESPATNITPPNPTSTVLSVWQLPHHSMLEGIHHS